MVEKLTWIWRFARSKTYVILLDKQSAVSIPLMDIDSFESQFMLSAQTASLYDFKARLEDLIREHEDAIRLLNHRKGVKQEAKRKSTSKSNVRKTTKAK